MKTKIKTYSELIKFKTFNERFKYLKLSGNIGEDTFGYDRYLNQALYKDHRWKKVRNIILVRDGGFDLGIDGLNIYGKIIVHHINPLTKYDIINLTDNVFNPEYLISASHKTHNMIHYGVNIDENIHTFINRKPNDTVPWKI